MSRTHADKPLGTKSTLAALIFVLVPLLFLIAGGVCVAEQGEAQMASEQRDSDDRLGRLVRDAVVELAETGERGPAYWEMNNARGVHAGSRFDPYLVWLQSSLMQSAVAGDLFVHDDDGLRLRLTWALGDDAAWYICRVLAPGDGPDAAIALGPKVIWPYYGEAVTPDGPDDDPSVTEYSLAHGEVGGLVQFDMFQLSRDAARHSVHIDAEDAVRSGEAELVIRMALPVITEP